MSDIVLLAAQGLWYLIVAALFFSTILVLWAVVTDYIGLRRQRNRYKQEQVVFEKLIKED